MRFFVLYLTLDLIKNVWVTFFTFFINLFILFFTGKICFKSKYARVVTKPYLRYALCKRSQTKTVTSRLLYYCILEQICILQNSVLYPVFSDYFLTVVQIFFRKKTYFCSFQLVATWSIFIFLRYPFIQLAFIFTWFTALWSIFIWFFNFYFYKIYIFIFRVGEIFIDV